MGALTAEAIALIKKETETVAESISHKAVRQFFDDEAKRRNRISRWFVGASGLAVILAAFALYGSAKDVIDREVAKSAKATVETVVVEATLKTVADNADQIRKKHLEVMEASAASIDKATVAFNEAESQHAKLKEASSSVENLRRQAAEKLAAFEDAALKVGDPDVLPKFILLSEVASSLTDTTLPALQETLEKSAAERIDKLLPIGSIVAWHKHPAGHEKPNASPMDVPEGWLECNGQQLPTHSNLYKLGARTVPNLNADTTYASTPAPVHSRLYLRGSTHSGNYEASQVGDHRHTADKYWTVGGQYFVAPVLDAKGLGFSTTSQTRGIAGSSEGAELLATSIETRPESMSVVWIIRVK